MANTKTSFRKFDKHLKRKERKGKMGLRFFAFISICIFFILLLIFVALISS